MKKHLLNPTLVALVAGAAFIALPLTAPGQSTEPTTPRAPAPDTRPSTNVIGKVESISDSTLTVAGRTVAINSSTTYSRAGASIGSGDIKVGYKVNVVTTENGQVAVAVDVISTD